ncbi:hypothetical protein AB2S62_19400 [Vibrio sp. NTOU-M3]|uniref:TadE/TadG family type IV pilus assembly protein n=1 Tax=Vibrio sp. NTOU-M3 TaxID=3234954 RepID=UPI00349FA46C
MKTKAGFKSKSQQGSASLLMLASLIIIMVLFFLSVSTTRYATLYTRLSHAADGALALVAREGLAVDEQEGQYLSKTFAIYNMPIGIRSEELRRTSQVNLALSPTGYAKELSLTLEDSIASVLSFVPQLNVAVERRLVREYPVTETVLALDASRSMSDKIGGGQKPSQLMPGILTDFIDSLTGEQELAKDHHIGLVPYSAHVNVGQRYQDRLITPESRRIPASLSPVARKYGYEQDFLHVSGVEGRRNGACVKRKPVNLNRVSTVLNLPRNAREGFDLMVYHPDEHDSEPGLSDEIKRANGTIPRHLLPVTQAMSFPLNPALPYIETPGGCPAMTLHEISGKTASLKNVAERYYATHTTGGDEGIIWGWRLFDERWRASVWEEPGFELEEPSKRFILFTDGANNKGLTDNDFERFMNGTCRALADSGIRFDMVLFDQGISMKERQIYRWCTDVTGGSYFYVKGDDLAALKLFFARLGIRQYKTRYL